jgi:hypothetical protein
VVFSKSAALMLMLAVCGYSTQSSAAGSVSEYLRDGWDIKSITQVSSLGYTQIVMQKGINGVICTIYYSAADNRWVAVGDCTPVP